VDVLLLTTLVTFACSAVLLETGVGQLALLDQLERTAIAFGGSVSDAQYARMEELSTRGIAYAALSTLMSGPVLTVVLAAILLVVARGALKVSATFTQALAIVAHAGVVLALRQVVAAPLNYALETLASPTTLVRLAGSLDESSPIARFLGVVDLFVVWWIVVLAIGVAALARRPVRPLAFAFTGVYVVLALLLALVMALTGGVA
jgi:hypothetical protein